MNAAVENLDEELSRYDLGAAEPPGSARGKPLRNPTRCSS